MYDYIDNLDIFHEDQYGFRRDRSTSHALIDQVQYLFDNIDSDNIVFSSFPDLRKAFDSVDFNILLSKLFLYGFRGTPLQLLKPYLSERTQCTSRN